jgi:N-acetylmuramoyl-L-alanine amidase
MLSYRHLRILLPVLATTIAATACAPGPRIPAQPDDVPGYQQAPPDLRGVDASPLRGRRILVDPGHGGYFRGAVGDDGLTEAEVNLGVALYLQGLLQWAGAEVHLTRTADVDFLTPADSSLTADLAARMDRCAALSPDAFVSIHHNSTANRDPRVNETQTYYPIGREGADLDLARCIHRRMVRALEIEPARILPGGFHVLRRATVPAVLGEPAMLSNPVMEGRLSLARSLELEATAYFLGLCDYFAGGTPRWASDLPDTLTVGDAGATLTWRFDPGYSDAPPLDPSSVTLLVDGRPAPFDPGSDGATVTVPVADIDLPAAVTVGGRNLAGRSAAPATVVVRRGDPGSVRWWLLASDRPGGLVVWDTGGRDLRAGPPADLVLDGDRGSVRLPVAAGARGWLVVEGATAAAIGTPLTVTDHGAGWVVERGEHGRLPTGARPLPLDCPETWWPGRAVPGGAWRTRLPLARPAADPVLRATGRPALDRRAPVVAASPGTPLWLEADGARPLLLDADGRTPWQKAGAPPPDRLTWEPLLPDLVNRRVALDPRGGGVDEQGRGPLGTRGADLNLEVARRLAALLRGAGCDVLLVREADLWVPDPERVRRADAFGAELYLAIGREGAPVLRHHHGSVFGTPWAARCADAAAPLLGATVDVAPSYDYILRHTACPAVSVGLERPADADAEQRLASPAWQDAVARALLRGTVAAFAPGTPSLTWADLQAALDDRAIAAARLDLVRLDGNFGWTPPSGQGDGAAVPSWSDGDPGLPVRGDRHLVELRSGPHWQLWALERPAVGGWRGRLVMENR